ncbi:MAG: hypothetical protein IKB72_03690 [Ruminococcus sp.]|nr:hypothetical protein [Ruminococcus sp.]
MIAVNGFELNILGVITINTKNYTTANDAYLAGSNCTDEIIDVAVIDVDNYNGFYIAHIGEDSLLVAQMKITDSKYYYLGAETIYDLANSRVDGLHEGELESTITSKLVSKTTYGGELEWALIKASDAESVSKDYTKVEIDASIDEEALVFVYRTNN